MGERGIPRYRKKLKCKNCGATEGVNRRSELCLSCAIGKVTATITQLKRKKGPIYEKWRRNIVKGAEQETLNVD